MGQQRKYQEDRSKNLFFLTSDNLTAAGRFLHDNYDSTTIMTIFVKLRKFQDKIQELESSIREHSDGHFLSNGLHLKTGCHFNHEASQKDLKVRDGAVLRALTSHQCGLCSIPRLGFMLVEFVGSLLCTERFSPGTPVSPLLKNQHVTCTYLAARGNRL